jgi:hypothetical protein
MIVQLVAYSPHETVDISRGENAGRVAEYHNVVRITGSSCRLVGAEPFVAEVRPRPTCPTR